MSHSAYRLSLLFIIICIVMGCANIVPPEGGKRDTTPPKLRSVKPADSARNARISRIDMRFDEYITVSDVTKELHISPALPVPLVMTGINKTVTIKIPDTLLQPNTTYRITFGNAIKDLHESNPYSGHSYMFSTGAWFDSMRLRGHVVNARTGLSDSGQINILLYEATLPADVVIKQKPSYVTSTDNSGSFLFEGLPLKNFRVFALKEKNDNLQFDADDEMIAFTDDIIAPGDSAKISLSIFKEENADSTIAKQKRQREQFANPGQKTSVKGFVYTVKADTNDKNRRTHEISGPLDIVFLKNARDINPARIALAFDSLDTEIEEQFNTSFDSLKQVLHINAEWRQNTLYTLRLLKGFAKDSAGNDAMPGKYIFRTKRDEDYGKLDVQLPAKYIGGKYLLSVTLNENDSVYLKAITSNSVSMQRLQPGIYTIRVIYDENENGQWDTGDLKKRRQPEKVYPYSNTIQMKPGWEHLVDFEKDKNKNR